MLNWEKVGRSKPLTYVLREQWNKHKHAIRMLPRIMKEIRDRDEALPVSVPISPTRAIQPNLHALIKSRLLWVIVVTLTIVAIILASKSYTEHQKQIRLRSYMERIDEFRQQLQHLQQSINRATLSFKDFNHLHKNQPDTSFTRTGTA